MKIKNPKGMPNPADYPDEVYRGNIPACKGGKWIVGDEVVVADKYACRFGGGEVVGGKVRVGDFSLNHKVTIHLTYDVVSITDKRKDSTTEIWTWHSKYGLVGRGLFLWEYPLEPEKIRQYLNAEVEDCLFWQLMQDSIFEIVPEMKL